MTEPTNVVLLACGSFNPITNNHLYMFEVARDALNRSGKFKVVGGIISPVSDHYEKKDLLGAKHRCAMIRVALETSDWIRLDTWECEQDAWTPTVEVLRHHRDQIRNTHGARVEVSANKKRRLDSVNRTNNTTPIQVKLLCGADLLESFATPYLWPDEDIEEIAGDFGIVVKSRPGSDAEQYIYDNDLLTKHQNNIYLVTDWMENKISSTKVRRALRRGESVKYIIPNPVLDYIYAHQLYAGTE